MLEYWTAGNARTFKIPRNLPMTAMCDVSRPSISLQIAAAPERPSARKRERK